MNEFLTIIITGILMSIIPNSIDHFTFNININHKISTILLWLFCGPAIILILWGLMYLNIFLILAGLLIYTALIILNQ